MIRTVFKKQYVYSFFLIFFLYLFFNIILSQFYITLQYIPRYLETIQWWKLIAAGILTLIIGFLVSLNVLLLYFQFQQRRHIKKQSVIVSIGTVGGFATGVCSACVAGFFPFLLGLFGISFSFLSLPFQGIEIQVLIIVLLGVNSYFLDKEKKTC